MKQKVFQDLYMIIFIFKLHRFLKFIYYKIILCKS